MTKTNLYCFKAVNTAFLLLAVYLITSCSSLPEVVSVQPEAWHDIIQQKNKIKSWDVKGRLGIQTEQDGGVFDFFWDQNKEDYTIRLIAPLGQGAFYIEGDSKQVSVRNSKGIKQDSSNPETLFKEHIGIDLSVGNLRAWMLGIPDVHLSVESLLWNEKGQLYKLEQAGWKIEMLRYQKVEDTVLPHFIVLQRDDRPELIVRLIIRRWTLND